jgi:hypothetical protein
MDVKPNWETADLAPPTLEPKTAPGQLFSQQPDSNTVNALKKNIFY